MRSSTPLVPSGMSMKLSLPTAFWAVVKVQWALPVTWRSPLGKAGVRAQRGLSFLSRQRPSWLHPYPAARPPGGGGGEVVGEGRAGASGRRWEGKGPGADSPDTRGLELPAGTGQAGARGTQAAPYLASREARWSAVLGSGLRGGDVTKAAALAQFLLQ